MSVADSTVFNASSVVPSHAALDKRRSKFKAYFDYASIRISLGSSFPSLASAQSAAASALNSISSSPRPLLFFLSSFLHLSPSSALDLIANAAYAFFVLNSAPNSSFPAFVAKAAKSNSSFSLNPPLSSSALSSLPLSSPVAHVLFNISSFNATRSQFHLSHPSLFKLCKNFAASLAP